MQKKEWAFYKRLPQSIFVIIKAIAPLNEIIFSLACRLIQPEAQMTRANQFFCHLEHGKLIARQIPTGVSEKVKRDEKKEQAKLNAI